MKTFITVVAVSVLTWGFVVLAVAEAPDAAEPSKSVAKKPAQTLPVFVPRESGAPVTRIGGATRGAGQLAIPSLDALAPEQIGFTLDGQPVLFWTLSEATDQRIDFTLRGPDSETPLVQRTLAAPHGAGVHRIALSDYGVSLKPETPYIWFVSLIPDAERRSEDRIAGGAIERVKGSDVLMARLASEERDRQVFVLAEEGLWYDALRSASDRIDSTPQGETARAQRAALLRQVGLSAVAERVGG